MDCRSFKELVAALALDALDEPERAACTAHLAESGPHDGCVEAEADARALAAQLAGAMPERPVGPRVWTAIEDRAQAELAARRAQGDADADGDERPNPRRREPPGWGVAVMLLGLYLARRPPIETARPDGTAMTRSACARSLAPAISYMAHLAAATQARHLR